MVSLLSKIDKYFHNRLNAEAEKNDSFLKKRTVQKHYFFRLLYAFLKRLAGLRLVNKRAKKVKIRKTIRRMCLSGYQDSFEIEESKDSLNEEFPYHHAHLVAEQSAIKMEKAPPTLFFHYRNNSQKPAPENYPSSESPKHRLRPD